MPSLRGITRKRDTGIIFLFIYLFIILQKLKINEGSSELNNEFVRADMMIKEEKT